MPQWQPNWEDVLFDHAGAEQAAAECDACAQFLVGRHAVLGPPLQAARVEWRGVHRERFDDETAALDHEADILTDELRMTAARIRGQAEDARIEQHRRQLERERWFEENAWEEAVERQRLADAAEAAVLGQAPQPSFPTT